ncbi:MAG: ECF transporter S component [Patescibacteria group bacterium]
MKNLRTLALENENLLTGIKFAVLLSLVLIAPLIGNQLVTGTIVNMTLILAILTLNLRSAILISLFPSFIALISGTLNPALAPVIPFIILSNILLASIFNYFKNRDYWMSIVAASFAKFIFLYLSSLFIFELILKEQIADMLSTTMGLFQLITALSGSILAYFIYKFIKK